ncbi:MAG: dUTP diphosphatase [Pseudomonadota bacterium]
MSPPPLVVQRLPHAGDLPPPAYETAGAAGLDLRAALSAAITLQPGQRSAVPTGFALAIPHGYEGQVRARSGRALREGLGLVNAPGTIDSDYRGELLVLAINLGDKPIDIAPGERIAQLVIAPVAQLPVAEAAALPPTVRGAGGFGHTGRR